MRRSARCGRGWWLLVALAVGGGVGCAQDARREPVGFSALGWSTESGLPQSSVHALAQTRDGYLWLGTEGGLARFDGYEFRVFDRRNTPGLVSDDVRCLLADRSGALWVGTATGLTRMQDGHARTFGEAEGVPAGAVRSMVADNHGGVWVGTSQGLLHVVGDRVEDVPAAGVGVEALASDGEVLLIATPTGLLRMREGVVTMMAKPAALPSAGVRLLLATRAGVWAGGRSSVSLMGPGGTAQFVTGKDLPGTQVTALAEDRRGGVWIGTNAGAVRVRNGRVEAAESGGDAVLALFEDREGDMWLGTETAGAKVLRPRMFELLRGPAEGTSTSVVQAGDGAVWTGSNGGGVTRIDAASGAARTYGVKDGLASDTVLALGSGGENADDVWVGTPDGVSVLHEGRWRTLTSDDGLGDDLVRSLLAARDGAVWMGTRRGVTRWKDGRVVTLASAQGLGSDLAGPMLEDAGGDLWVGTSGGLSRVHDGVTRNYTVADGLPSNTITTLESSANGGFWVGTQGQGIAHGDGEKFFSFANARTLPREIYGLLEDGSGSLWMSSEHAIFRVSGEALKRFEADPKRELEVESFGAADGLPAIETEGAGYPSAWKLKDGRLAFASRRGVVVLNPLQFPQAAAPPVVLEQVTVDDRPATPEEMASLAPGPAHFAFSFAGISFAAPQRVQYRYRMEGLDRQWTQAGTRRTAYYTNLPHGRYRFLVCARMAGGAWSEPVAMPLVLRPYFYQTWWFRTLCALLLAAVGAGLYWVRLRTLQGRFDAVAAERERLAREIHDTLAQSFVAVSVRLEVMAQMLRSAAGVEGARAQLDQTRALVRAGLEEARRSIWDLRAEGPEAQSLPARLARLVREKTSEETEVRLETTGTYRALARSMEDELYRIAQEALTNALRHAKARTVDVRLSYELEWMLLEIADDGVGFDVAQAPSRDRGHFGLSGMRERGSMVGAEVMLESVAGKGTQVRVSVPLAVTR